jgi:hypothetical protein
LPADISRRSTIESLRDPRRKDRGIGDAKQDGGDWSHESRDQFVSQNDTFVCSGYAASWLGLTVNTESSLVARRNQRQLNDF